MKSLRLELSFSWPAGGRQAFSGSILPVIFRCSVIDVSGHCFYRIVHTQCIYSIIFLECHDAKIYWVVNSSKGLTKQAQITD